MKIVSLVGTRLEFIQAWPVSRALRQRYTEVLIHTGQHYDYEMSNVFFDELELPEPNYSLGVGSGSSAVQTAQILLHIEKVLIHEQPNYVIVRGDTNSTLAGALAAAQLRIPIVHIEAGMRNISRTMPEEVNRIIVENTSGSASKRCLRPWRT
ncbi:MAG: UDP-N-acetylglucosamine 2-epimerase [Candidatus Aminicenantes bacterium]|nr:UDP-N-acetylglucosamine 2-epimerase [Candidatus Aminicenantes bacterium]